jgi:hypothetical protein
MKIPFWKHIALVALMLCAQVGFVAAGICTVGGPGCPGQASGLPDSPAAPHYTYLSI